MDRLLWGVAAIKGFGAASTKNVELREKNDSKWGSLRACGTAALHDKAICWPYGL